MKWTIGKKLFVMGAGVVIVLTVMGGISYQSNLSVRKEIDTMNKRMHQLEVVQEIRENTLRLMLMAMDSIVDKGEGNVSADRMKLMNSSIDFIARSLDALQQAADHEEEQEAVRQIQATFPKLAKGIQEDLVNLITSFASQEEFERLDNIIDPYGEQIEANLAALEKSIHAEQEEAETVLFQTITWATNISLVTFVIALAVLIPALMMFSRSITKPLSQVVNAANTIAEGDLSQELHIQRQDEIGVLAEAMRNMIINLRGTVQVAEQIAAGDLTARTNILSERDTLGKSLDTMATKLNETVTIVQNGAINVASGSQEMSQGASEQAAAVEEASSSMEEMTANIRQNADNATQTENIAAQTAASARESGDAVVETVRVIKEIAEKISIVEEIARQTHTLSLNATIEAAKAQEYGKGFAVVASEVRALAERSRMSASEINALASSSVAIAEKASAMLAKLVPDIQKTAELVQEIGAASREQNTGAGQINTAIQQLDQVIQQNASVSEELASQAEQLQSTVEFFNTDGAGRKPTQTQPVSAPLKKVTHIKAQKHEEETNMTERNGNPGGYAMNMKPQGQPEDPLDSEFERF